VAEKVAETLGYECIAREALLEASEQFNIPEVKLTRAVHDAPSILDRFTSGKERYVSYIRAALVRHVLKDNVVYHGLAGQFFFKKISHVLKVRIVADMEDRIAFVMERDTVSEKEAHQIIEKDDHERRKWSKHLYGIDTTDASLYDLVLHVRKITADDAVGIICKTVQLDRFQKTDESQQALEDLGLASEVKSRLVEIKPDISVCACEGTVTINAVLPLLQQEILADKMREAAKGIPGVKMLRVNAIPPHSLDLAHPHHFLAEDGVEPASPEEDRAEHHEEVQTSVPADSPKPT
jgi:cytidylate kinase